MCGVRKYFSFYLFIYLLFIYFGCVGSSLLHVAFSSCGEQGLLFVVVPGLLTAVASLVVEHGLYAHGLSSCGAQV